MMIGREFDGIDAQGVPRRFTVRGEVSAYRVGAHCLRINRRDFEIINKRWLELAQQGLIEPQRRWIAMEVDLFADDLPAYGGV